MDTYYTLASLTLFLATIYVLARADGWSKLSATLVAVGSFAVPAVAVVALIVFPVPAIVSQTVSGAGPVGAMIVLLALAKSVAKKTSEF